MQALGLTLSELSADDAKTLKLKGGVRIVGVTGPATRAGLREGDVIVAVANSEVTSVKDVEAALARLDKNKPVSLLLRRGEWAQYAVVRPQAR